MLINVRLNIEKRLLSYFQAAIRKELNDFKKEEMEVHEQSRQYTRYSHACRNVMETILLSFFISSVVVGFIGHERLAVGVSTVGVFQSFSFLLFSFYLVGAGIVCLL